MWCNTDVTFFSLSLSLPDVGGKVIHLVERAPPPVSQPSTGSGGASADSGASSTSSGSQGTSQVPPHDRNANSYVMLGTFNLPVNIMDPQQIQVIIYCSLMWYVSMYVDDDKSFIPNMLCIHLGEQLVT